MNQAIRSQDIEGYHLQLRAERLDDKEIDVVILGAGINGAGLFRDLSEQGVKCLIIDKSDFGSGTSAAPSRLIHGGLKYLETGEFGLVAQSTLERNLLLKNAPHFVRALPTMIPIFSWTRGVGPALRTFFGSTTAPRSRGAILVKFGLALYDYYGSRDRVMPRHHLVGKRQALQDMPGLTDKIVAAGTYYDAMITAPERLVFELIQDGMKANPGSAAANGTTLVSSEQGKLKLVLPHGATITICPRLVVNAAGPWIDDVNAALGAPSKMIGGTKGSHIVLQHDELIKRLDGRMIYFEADDGRICLVFDFLGRVLVGSTDTPSDDPEDVHCEANEIDYFLESLRTLLPDLAFEKDQIVFAYSGIRPLPVSDSTQPGLISRDHSAPLIEATPDRPFPIISLVGGKWTTFRGFSEEVSDTILQHFGVERKCSTRSLPIGGGKNYPLNDASREAWLTMAVAETGEDRDRLSVLLDRYGTLAISIAHHCRVSNSREQLQDADTYSAAEIDWIARNEFVVHLDDIVLRRTTLAITGILSDRDLRRIAQIAGEALGWSEKRVGEEIIATQNNLVERHLMHL